MAKRPTVFVLLPAGSVSEERFRQAIKPACEASAADCRRAEDVAYHGELIQEIYRELEKADVIVADLSGNNPNVLYELGYAHALKRPTLLLAESLRDVPFDVRGSRVIAYGGDLGTLRTQLSNALTEMLRPPDAAESQESGTWPLSYRTLTIVIGDVVRSTELAALLGELDVAEALREDLRRIQNYAVEHGGIDFISLGDGFLTTFERTDDALAFALEIRTTGTQTQFPHIRLRLAIHRSPINVRRTRHGTDLVGEGINLAVRFANAAKPDQLLLSSAAVSDLSPGRLTPPVETIRVQVTADVSVEATLVGPAS